jgi:sortase family protein
MRRLLTSLLLPILLAVAGVGLIVVSNLNLDQTPGPSLPPIGEPSTSGIAIGSPGVEPSGQAGSTAPTPSPTAPPDDWLAVQLEIPSVGLNVLVKHAVSAADCDFPPEDAAYVLCGGSQPGRGTNSYVFAHAELNLFKRLWNVQLGDEVKVLMSDNAVLRYVVTEVRPNVSCPDDRVDPHPNPPLALKYAPPGCEEGAAWTAPTDHERLTLQTSQGYNRNWGELVIVAKPAS